MSAPSSGGSDTDDPIRAGRILLEAVAVLHQRGFEGLRVSPGMSASGVYWRCGLDGHGGADEGARYSTSTLRRYFEWDDTAEDEAAELATKIESRMPELMRTARRSDPAYARWFAEMLARTAPDELPIAYADWDLPEGFWSTIGGAAQRVPLPPP